MNKHSYKCIGHIIYLNMKSMKIDFIVYFTMQVTIQVTYTYFTSIIKVCSLLFPQLRDFGGIVESLYWCDRRKSGHQSLAYSGEYMKSCMVQKRKVIVWVCGCLSKWSNILKAVALLAKHDFSLYGSVSKAQTHLR